MRSSPAPPPPRLPAPCSTAAAQDNGGPVSDPNIITDGNITWSGPGGDATGVGTDQQGLGSAYQYFWPCCGGNDTDFFQYIGPGLSGAGLGAAGQAGGGYVGRTFGLLQASNGLPTPDPQWPFAGGANFAVNPVNSADVVISSSVGRIFVTQNSGVTWFDIGDPGGLRQPEQLQPRARLRRPGPQLPRQASATSATSSTSAPRPGRSTSPRMVVAAARATTGSISPPVWTAKPIKSIITDPIRGSHDAYAVTTDGVFYMANSIPSATNRRRPGSTSPATSKPGVLDLRPDLRPDDRHGNSVTLNQAITLSAIMADWRYQIPNQSDQPQPRALTRCCTSARAAPAATARGCSSRSTTARRGPSSPTRRMVPSRREAIYLTSPSPTSTCRWATSTPTRACPSWPARTRHSSLPAH